MWSHRGGKSCPTIRPLFAYYFRSMFHERVEVNLVASSGRDNVEM